MIDEKKIISAHRMLIGEIKVYMSNNFSEHISFETYHLDENSIQDIQNLHDIIDMAKGIVQYIESTYSPTWKHYAYNYRERAKSIQEQIDILKPVLDLEEKGFNKLINSIKGKSELKKPEVTGISSDDHLMYHETGEIPDDSTPEQISEIINEFSDGLPLNNNEIPVQTEIHRIEKSYSKESNWKRINRTKEELIEEIFNILEDDFQKIFMKYLDDLGFSDRHCNHGTNEFGKDIIASSLNEFRIQEWSVFILKVGNIKQSDANTINNRVKTIDDQIKNSYKIPYHSINHGEVKITRIFVVTNETINDHARTVLINQNKEINGKLFFIDREKLIELCKKDED